MKDYQIQLKEAKRKTYRIKICASDVVELTVPLGTAASQIEQIVSKNRQRIVQMLERYRLENPAFEYADGSTILYLGNPLMLKYVTDAGYSWKLDDKLFINARYQTVTENVLKVFYKARAEILRYRCKQLARQHGFTPQKISLRWISSRWGSCSANGNISLNIKLMMAPPHITDYVIIHELAHLQHHNHSAAYWALVQKLVPDYMQHRTWLKNYGHTLKIHPCSKSGRQEMH